MSDGPSKTSLPNRDTWPKAPSGTVDWETVFEQPETGLMAYIARAETAAELRAATQAVIAQLFPRKDDEDGTARLAAELVELLPEDTGPATLKPVVEAVQQMLRGIKEFRQKKAAEYEKEQSSKPPQDKSAGKPVERRKPGKQPPSIKKTMHRKRMLVFVAATALLVLIGGAFGAYEFLDLSPAPAGEKPKKLAYCEFPKVTVVLKNETSRVVHSAVIAVTAEFNDADALAACKAAQPRILDALQVYLRNTTYEELQGTGGSELLRAETLNIVNREVGPFRANTILFKQILIQ